MTVTADVVVVVTVAVIVAVFVVVIVAVIVLSSRLPGSLSVSSPSCLRFCSCLLRSFSFLLYCSLQLPLPLVQIFIACPSRNTTPSAAINKMGAGA